MASKKNWPSIKDGIKPTKTDVKYDPHMKIFAPMIKKAKAKRRNKMKIKQGYA